MPGKHKNNKSHKNQKKNRFQGEEEESEESKELELSSNSDIDSDQDNVNAKDEEAKLDKTQVPFDKNDSGEQPQLNLQKLDSGFNPDQLSFEEKSRSEGQKAFYEFNKFLMA